MLKKKKKTYTRLKDDQGFTLIETIIAMAIFAIGILAVAKMMDTATYSNASARRLTDAASIAMDRLENLISLPYDHADLQDTNGDGAAGLEETGGNADYEQILNNAYTLNWNIAPIDLDADGDIDNNGTGLPDAKTVTVIVSWRDRGRTRDLSITDYIAEFE
jgi:prepilin-type N-terminal cleavage/methylation domain-containing protein